MKEMEDEEVELTMTIDGPVAESENLTSNLQR
jgi:hypothetical protein